MSNLPAYIHHVNFPTTNPERTIEWYSKVFGMKYIKPKSNTKVVLMTRGNFDLHFTPVEEMDRMAPYHFAVEVEDWEGFLAHLDSLGITLALGDDLRVGAIHEGRARRFEQPGQRQPMGCR